MPKDTDSIYNAFDFRPDQYLCILSLAYSVIQQTRLVESAGSSRLLWAKVFYEKGWLRPSGGAVRTYCTLHREHCCS